MSEEISQESPITEDVSEEIIESPEGDEAIEAIEAKTYTQEQLEAAIQEKLNTSLKRKMSLKVDGEELEEDVDLGDEEWVRKQLQLAKVSQKRMQDYATQQKQIETFVEMLKKDPGKILSDPNIGIDLKQFAQDIINQEIENSQKSPEQLEIEELQAKLKDIEDQKTKLDEERKAEEFQRLQDKEEQRLEIEIQNALETGNLPKTRYTIDRMTDLMLMAAKNDIDLRPDQIAPMLKNKMKDDLHNMFKAMPEDIIEEFVGKDNLTRLQKKRLAGRKNTPVNKVVSTGKSDITNEEKKDEKQTIRDFFGV